MKNKHKKTACMALFLTLLLLINAINMPYIVKADDDLQTIEKDKDVIAFSYADEKVSLTIQVDKKALPEHAQLSVTPVVSKEEVQSIVTKEVMKDVQKINTLTSYDIKFLLDDQVIPFTSVATIDMKMSDTKSDMKVFVYHYDEAKKMTSGVKTNASEQGHITFQTKSLTNLFFVNGAEKLSNVTIEHYNEPYTLETTKETVKSAPIAASDKLMLAKGSGVSKYIKKQNWVYTKIVQVTKDAAGKSIETPIQDINKLSVAGDATYRMYYKTEVKNTNQTVASAEQKDTKTETTGDFELSKTSRVHDFAERTYDIHLEASTIPSTVLTPIPTDIVLLLDRSSSMNIDFTQYKEYKGNMFEEGSTYYYKTKYGIYQKLIVDLKNSNNTAIFIDTENNSNKVNITLGKNKVYIFDDSNYELFTDDEFKGETYEAPWGELIWQATENYFYRLNDQFLVINPTAPTRGVVRNNGGNNFEMNLANPDDKAKVYTAKKQMSKLDILNDAAVDFVDSVKTISPDSRIGIVDYSSNGVNAKGKPYSFIHEINGKTLLNVSQQENITSLKNIITDSDVRAETGGTTRSDIGLQLVNKALEEKSKWDSVESGSVNRQTMVVFFTDGVITGDTGSYSPTNANKASTIASQIKRDFNTPIYALSVFDDASIYGSLQGEKSKVTVDAINKDMLRIASENDYMCVDNAESLKDKFIEISMSTADAINGAVMTDVIDNRFELTKESADELIANGAKITENDDGTTTLTWSNQLIRKKNGNIPGWSKNFRVIAKSDYIGGNNIPTNGVNSYIVAAGKKKNFPMPYVNVKVVNDIGDENETLFLGESIPEKKMIMEKVQNIINTNITKYKVSKDAFEYRWTDSSNKVVDKKWSDIYPIDQTKYKLTFTYYAGATTDNSNRNTTTSDGVINYSGLKDENFKVVNTGVYTIYVMKGQLQITKQIDDPYTTIKPIHANQTFIFKIERFDVDSNNQKKGTVPVETFYETINFAANEEGVQKSKLISGLKKGYYTVTEETAWSDKYNLVKTEDNYSKNKKEGLDLFIGDRIKKEATLTTYYGLEKDKDFNCNYADGEKAVVTFTNNLDRNWIWMSDVAAAVNAFIK